MHELSHSQRTGLVQDTRPLQWLRGYRLQLLSAAFTLAEFMAAVDDSILACAIPRITSELQSLHHIGWYGSAYPLAQLIFQPLFGRVYMYFEARQVYLISLSTFAIGSIICALAPASWVLISGRAVTGCGAAGMLTGSLAIFGDVVPMRLRPQGLAIITMGETIGWILGSTIGGVITDSFLTWRFCFWINIPIILVVGTTAFLILETKRPLSAKGLSTLEKIQKIDPITIVPLALALIFLFFSFQKGGTTLPWSDPRVWACLLASIIFGITFIWVQYLKGEDAIVPRRILAQRTVAICSMVSFLYGFANYTQTYMLPIYFQGVRDTTAAMSSVYCLAILISSAISILIYGFSATIYGTYMPFLWIGSIVYFIGSLMLSCMTPASGTVTILAYQVVCGIGIGLSVQVTFIAVQVAVSSMDMPTACSMEVFFRELGGSLGISLSQNVFGGLLVTGLGQLGLSFSGSTVDEGFVELVEFGAGLPPDLQSDFKETLNRSIMHALALPVAVTALAAAVSWGLKEQPLQDKVDYKEEILIGLE